MQTFEEIESLYRNSLLIADGDDRIEHGSFILAGDKSCIKLITKSLLQAQETPEGWISIDAKGPDSKRFKFIDCLSLTSVPLGLNRWSTDFYPNIVMLGAERLTASEHVREINFRLHGLSHFFHYRHIERFYVTKEDGSFLHALRKAGGLGRGFVDFKNPFAYYAARRSSRVFSIKMPNQTYSIRLTLSEVESGNDRLSLKVTPHCRIQFHRQVNIKEALQAAYDWCRFFNQLACDHLPLVAIAMGASKVKLADIYLPGEDRPAASAVPREWIHLPFNSWKSRQRLAKGMRNWLQADDQRRSFRLFLNRVLGTIRSRSDLTDVLLLCSAVESLPVDGISAQTIPKKVLKEMSQAAIDYATDHNVTDISGRVKGLLGNLNRPSLALRLNHLLDILPSPVTDEDRKLLIDSATALRTAVAHGKPIGREIELRSGPTAQALVGACALFDQHMCGFPAESDYGGAVPAARLMTNGLGALRQLQQMGA